MKLMRMTAKFKFYLGFISLVMFVTQCSATDLILRWEPSTVSPVTYRIRWGPRANATYFFTNSVGTNLCGTIPLTCNTSIWVVVKAVYPSLPLPTEYDVPLQPTYVPSQMLIEDWICGLAFWAPLYDAPVTIESAQAISGPWAPIATVGSPEYFPRYKIGVAPALDKPQEFFRTFQ